MGEHPFEKRLRDAGLIAPLTEPTSPPVNGHHPQPDHPLVKAALNKRIAELIDMPKDSGRNDALNKAAAYLGRFPIPRDQLRSELLGACQANGLYAEDGEQQCDATIRSGFSKADRDGPRTIENRTPVNGLDTSSTNVNDNQPIESPTWGTRPPVDATKFLFDADDTIPTLWGQNDDILWAEGEALMIAGSQGLGKTTLAGQIIRAQLQLDETVLGLPVTPTQTKILYLAMDRPRQIRRSMLRQFDPTERQQISGRLYIRTGPPIADMAANPTLLARMAEEADAGIIYIDSLKDAAIGLSNDEVGAGYNRARQHLLAQNRQICELHHLVKHGPGGTPPNNVADIYGSTWLTSGCGSIIMLTGEPGDPIIGFRHAKQPLGEVGPWRLLHNQHTGTLHINHHVDLVDLATHSGAQGLTAKAAAAATFDTDKPTRAQIEKARYRLDQLAETGMLTCVEGSRGGAHDNPTVWFPGSQIQTERNQTE